MWAVLPVCLVLLLSLYFLRLPRMVCVCLYVPVCVCFSGITQKVSTDAIKIFWRSGMYLLTVADLILAVNWIMMQTNAFLNGIFTSIR